TLTFSGYGEAVAAAVAGQGVALGRRPLIDDLLKSGALVAPFRDLAASPRGYFMVVEPGARQRASVQALLRWLQEEAGAV
ncbi:MAG: LysR substrate-binding domain-containing protein, partial [Rubrivivax sp.]